MEWGIKETFARLPPIPRNLLLLERLTFIHYSWPQLSYCHAASRVHSSSLSLSLSLSALHYSRVKISYPRKTRTRRVNAWKICPYFQCALHEEESDTETRKNRIAKGSIRFVCNNGWKAVFSFVLAQLFYVSQKKECGEKCTRCNGVDEPPPLFSLERREWETLNESSARKDEFNVRGMFLRFNDYRLKLQVGEIHEARGK